MKSKSRTISVEEVARRVFDDGAAAARMGDHMCEQELGVHATMAIDLVCAMGEIKPDEPVQKHEHAIGIMLMLLVRLADANEDLRKRVFALEQRVASPSSRIVAVDGASS